MNEQNPIGRSTKYHAKLVLVPFMILVMILLSAYLVSLTRNSWESFNYIGQSPEYQDRVSISGTGKVTAKPDVAIINVGVITDKATVEAAQKENTDKMNAIIAELKNQYKIADEDIKTSYYQINPRYNWNDGRQTLAGYEVNQSVQVKVRNFDNIGKIVSMAGERGANSVSGPNFTIDDPETYKAEARKEAIAQAKDKAKVLADEVGINLGRIVSFSEDSYQPYAADYAYGMGGIGGFDEQKALSSAPSADIQSGSQEISVNVYITYEIAK
ncbi:MAG TPA: SIMPL domain-containing protein [bacterium]|nr:SIMPL domain-containing protein [bacterium]HPW39799.1 SIMPL domain-containing protein [bacterium]